MELLDPLKLKPDTFAGRVTVVTGAARGLAHLDAHVIILDILEEGEEVAARRPDGRTGLQGLANSVFAVRLPRN